MENLYAEMAAQGAPEVPEEESTWLALKAGWLDLSGSDLLSLRAACKNDDRWEELPPKIQRLLHKIASAARKNRPLSEYR